MNRLVFLDAVAGELEKILSGVKTMIVKEYDPARSSGVPVRPGDCLYFLRNKDEWIVRVRATVVRVLPAREPCAEELAHLLKALQRRLQLTEEQYSHWAQKRQALFVGFESAHKAPEVRVSPCWLQDRTTWIAFQGIQEITSGFGAGASGRRLPYQVVHAPVPDQGENAKRRRASRGADNRRAEHVAFTPHAPGRAASSGFAAV